MTDYFPFLFVVFFGLSLLVCQQYQHFQLFACQVNGHVISVEPVLAHLSGQELQVLLILQALKVGLKTKIITTWQLRKGLLHTFEDLASFFGGSGI